MPELTDSYIQGALRTALGADAVLAPGFPFEPPRAAGLVARWWHPGAETDYDHGYLLLRWHIEIALSTRGDQDTGPQAVMMVGFFRELLAALDRSEYSIAHAAVDVLPPGESYPGYTVAVVTLEEQAGLSLE